MRNISSFPRGGVHPPGRKHLACDREIVRLTIPTTLVVPLSQHLGAPAKAIVEKGQKVTLGERIAEAAGFISADIHAPASGTVTEIRKLFLANGLQSDAIVISRDVDGAGVVDEPVARVFENVPIDFKWIASLDTQDIIKAVKDAGIVGLGGATFPAHVKFAVPKGKKAEYLVINGVECEPYLTADHRLMLERTDEILAGIQIIARSVECERVIIGIENNKPDAIKRISDRIAALELTMEVQPLKVKYPQGDEKQLLKASIGREVPSGGLPIEIGAVVANIGTAHAVYEAVVLGKSLYERVVTISGGSVVRPGNFLVRVGTPVSALIEAAGGLKGRPAKIVSGGPMMGFSFYDLETPVTKGTSGILILDESEIDRTESTACISCGKCVYVCPMGLQPTKLFKLIEAGRYQDAMSTDLMDCKECGCCSFVCPAKLSLVQGMRTGKRMARKRK